MPRVSDRQPRTHACTVAFSWAFFSIAAADPEPADLLERDQQIQHDVHLRGDPAADPLAGAVSAAAGRSSAGPSGIPAVHRAPGPSQAGLQGPPAGRLIHPVSRPALPGC